MSIPGNICCIYIPLALRMLWRSLYCNSSCQEELLSISDSGNMIRQFYKALQTTQVKWSYQLLAGMTPVLCIHYTDSRYGSSAFPTKLHWKISPLWDVMETERMCWKDYWIKLDEENFEVKDEIYVLKRNFTEYDLTT